MQKYLFIGLGGFLGATSRFGISVLFSAKDGFPVATFIINLLGAFFLGLILSLGCLDSKSKEVLKSFIITGFISSFTTFSTFSYEIFILIQQKLLFLALAYCFGSTFFGVLLAWLGTKLGIKWTIGLGERGRSGD